MFRVILKVFFRPYKRFIYTAGYLLYDSFRYLRYSASLKGKLDRSLEYKIIKNYHSIEKSLSFKNRNKSAGWGAAADLMELLTCKYEITAQRESAIKVLSQYLEQSELDEKKRERLELFLSQTKASSIRSAGGTLTLKSEFLLSGKLEDPEMFFHSRYSLRAFKNENVDEKIIKRAFSLASKTPSVCNRQSWKVYHLNNKSLIQEALRLQNGNKGFSEEINDLLVIATDLRSFDAEIERFQCWVDGGIYSMSLVYAFHSIGIGSCYLNLSLPPSKDIALRKLLNAPKEYSFISMMAIGYPEDTTQVCVSTRGPIDNYCFKVGGDRI